MNTEMDLPKLGKDLKISYERSFTIYEFIKEIKEKMKIFDTKKEEKNKKANLNIINIYKKDMEANLMEILYEYKISYRGKDWSLFQ